MSLKQLQRRLVLGLAALVALAAVFTIGLYIYRSVYGYDYDSSLYGQDLSSGVQVDKSITNIALFGLDTRQGDTQSHSDAVMILTVDNTRGKIKLTSLMRDSIVTIDEHGEDKLNAAYFLGGAALAIRTINENFGTDIANYIAVDFEQLADIIDEIGGVTINVSDYELAELNRVIEDYATEQGKKFRSVSKAGEQKLDGVQAMCYARLRKNGTGDDWARVERQSVVLNALFQEVQDLSTKKMIRLMQKVLPNTTTSLTPTDLASLIAGALANGKPVIEHTRVPQDGDWSYYGDNGQYVLYDLDKAADTIHQYIYNDVFPGDTSASLAPSTGETVQDDNGAPDDTTAPLTEHPTAGTTGDTENPDDTEDGPSKLETDDPESYVEEGGSYDAETGDYLDSDGDRYYLDEDGDRIYY